jgi:hypothetical protein
MLSVIGEGGVSSTTSTHPSVQAASRILDTEDVDFQQTGWWFNREHLLTLVPDNEGRVSVPASALDLRISDVERKLPAEKLRYVRRGNYIYDSIEHTNVISRKVVVDIIVRLPIESLPSLAASYLMHKSRQTINLDDDGDTFKAGELEKQTMIAFAKLKAAELKITGVNALDSPYAQRLLSRIGSGYSRNPNLIGGQIR